MRAFFALLEASLLTKSEMGAGRKTGAKSI
jgi:hypothetical protein